MSAVAWLVGAGMCACVHACMPVRMYTRFVASSHFSPVCAPHPALALPCRAPICPLQKESFVELVETIGRKTGGLSVYPFTSPVRGKPDEPLAKIMVRGCTQPLRARMIVMCAGSVCV